VIATRLVAMSLFGIFNVNKPPGWTSRRAVNHIQRFVRPAKVGHAGTLDPLATGVLLICVGPATRLVEYCHRLPKSYRATFLLGHQSPTDDTEVESEYLPDAPKPTRAQIEAALLHFQGKIEQRPPLFSAVKIQGQRAYQIARKGKQVELPMRVVTIHTIDLITYAYPELVLDIKCSTGTYIRALGRDLAFSLNTAAVMSALERTAIGNFQIEDSLDLTKVSANNVSTVIRPPLEVLDSLPSVKLTPEQELAIGHGQRVSLNLPEEASECVAINETGMVKAIVQLQTDGRYRAVQNFPNG